MCQDPRKPTEMPDRSQLASLAQALAKGRLDASREEVLEELVDQCLSSGDDKALEEALKSLPDDADRAELERYLRFHSESAALLVKTEKGVEAALSVLFAIPVLLVRSKPTKLPAGISGERLNEVGRLLNEHKLVGTHTATIMGGTFYPLEWLLVPYSRRRKALSRLLGMMGVVSKQDPHPPFDVGGVYEDEGEVLTLRYLVGALAYPEEEKFLPLTDYAEEDLKAWLMAMSAYLSGPNWRALVGAPALFSLALEQGLAMYQDPELRREVAAGPAVMRPRRLN